MINFKQYPNLTKIVIPNKVRLSTTDFNNAFCDMMNLQSVQLSDKITNLSNAFTNCGALKNLYVVIM